MAGRERREMEVGDEDRERWRDGRTEGMEQGSLAR